MLHGFLKQDMLELEVKLWDLCVVIKYYFDTNLKNHWGLKLLLNFP